MNERKPDCIARYQGKCAWCEKPINVGDEIKYWRSNAYHFKPCSMDAYNDSQKELTHEQKTRPGYL